MMLKIGQARLQPLVPRELPSELPWSHDQERQYVYHAGLSSDVLANIIPVRESAGKEFYEYWAALIPQSEVRHQIQLLWSSQTIEIPPSTACKLYEDDKRQWSYETKDPVPLEKFGPTIRGPLGWRVLGRSGDKASHANVGLFVENDDEWEWLRSFLTVDKMKELLGREYNGKLVERFEIRHIRAVCILNTGPV
jgi:hypothetical protein